MVVLIVVLPSALNLPQSNPNTVPEFAPVPSDEGAPQAGDNFSSLGVVSGGGGTSQSSLSDEVLTGTAKRPSTKRCVGNPPRQTSDPLSPPCVAFFEGNNGGETYTGVSKAEVQVLWIAFQATAESGGGQCQTSRGCEPPPPLGYVDVNGDDDFIYTRMIRLYQRHFNNRYQTYNRFVHFWIYYGNGTSPSQRRAEAEDNFKRIHPFAVLDFKQRSPDYLQAMAQKGVMNFLPSGTFTLAGQRSQYLSQFPGLVWGYDPTVEIRARNFASYVCSQVVPFKTSFGGNDADPDARIHNGQPRRLGLLWSSSPGSSQLKTYADIVRRDVNSCGGNIVEDRNFAYWCPDIACSVQDPTPAAQNIAQFKSQGVSTIIWPGGPDGHHSNAAAKIGYFPEVILGGDNYIEATFQGQWQDKAFWQRAYAVTTYPKQNPFDETPCMQAAYDADPNASRQDVRDFGCKYFDAIRQLFTGIQVAGARLTPAAMDKGYHSIPSIRSTDPRVPSCFYEPDDYTCAKDATAEWWDPAGDDPENSNPGCWRLIQGGKRYLPGTWPNVDVPSLKANNDPCNPQGLAI